MAGLCVGSRWPNPVRGRAGGAGMRCKSRKTGRFIPNRNCNRCPSSLGVKYSGGKYRAPKAVHKYFRKGKKRR